MVWLSRAWNRKEWCSGWLWNRKRWWRLVIRFVRRVLAAWNWCIGIIDNPLKSILFPIHSVARSRTISPCFSTIIILRWSSYFSCYVQSRNCWSTVFFCQLTEFCGCFTNFFWQLRVLSGCFPCFLFMNLHHFIPPSLNLSTHLGNLLLRSQDECSFLR